MRCVIFCPSWSLLLDIDCNKYATALRLRAAGTSQYALWRSSDADVIVRLQGVSMTSRPAVTVRLRDAQTFKQTKKQPAQDLCPDGTGTGWVKHNETFAGNIMQQCKIMQGFPHGHNSHIYIYIHIFAYIHLYA